MKTITTDFLEKFPTQEEVESLIRGFDATRESHKENRQYRMENYYNCVDDYSFGGPCDRAQDEEGSKMNLAQSLLKEQLENGKPFTEEFRIPVLTDLDGNIVSDRIVEGRFGECWIIIDKSKEFNNASFVSVSKKNSTYNKKGYKVMEFVYLTEYYFTTKMSKNGLISVARVLKQELQDCQELPKYSFHTKLPSVLYFALNN